MPASQLLGATLEETSSFRVHYCVPTRSEVLGQQRVQYTLRKTGRQVQGGGGTVQTVQILWKALEGSHFF